MTATNLIDVCPTELLDQSRKDDFLKWLGAHNLPDHMALRLSTHWGKHCGISLTAADRIRLITTYKGGPSATVPEV